MNVDVESGKTNEIGVCSVRTVVKPGRTAFDWQDYAVIRIFPMRSGRPRFAAERKLI
jgi:hypothetical protein